MNGPNGVRLPTCDEQWRDGICQQMGFLFGRKILEIILIAFAIHWIATAGCYQADGDWEWEKLASNGQQDIRYSSLISLICALYLSLSAPIDCKIEVERRAFFLLPLLSYFRLRHIIISRAMRVSEFGSAIDYWLFGSSNALRFQHTTLVHCDGIFFVFLLLLISVFDELLRLDSEIDFILMYRHLPSQ